MNPPHHSSIPAYRKWYFGAGGSVGAQGMRAVAESAPLPFEAIRIHEERNMGPPSTPADGYSAQGTFTIPEGADGKKLYGTCSLFLGVDDWGSLEVKDSGGKVVAQVNLKENPQTAGAQGGHSYHTGVGGAQLPSGAYTWEVSQTNIDYQPASGNTSICNYSIDVVPTEPGGRKEPEPCSCEGNTCDESGGTPPTPSRSGPGGAGMESNVLGNYSSAGCSVTAESTATLMYAANELNQYSRIEESGEAPFVPTYDASGNQTLIRTSTGIWTVAYNAANRAVSFTSQNGNTIIECGYDYQGRRYMKKVTVNGTVVSHERYLYRGYLQIAALDMLNSRNVLRTLLWDPLEPTATRPLALMQDNTLYCYGWDFNKNVTEVFDAQGTIAAAYDYSPYGAVTSTGSLVQPVQWSGEMHDDDLALVYYNYRYYNPKDGRWINRDPIAEQGGWNLYGFVGNTPILKTDILGRQFPPGSAGVINNAIKSAAINATRNVGLNQCDAKERVASENCCVIYYCILKQHIYFINNIQGNFICRNCNELKEETLKYGGMYPACDPHFIRETIYIPSIKK
ncbi:RHS repeat-associated core domain-containing protein [uncultured Akkermansia sp.]|uniref:RHS repeat-associated core domain-containing protein n=2 Tax=uncultured Akkermansia sp. TaxID=512294 RepID=UPI00263991E5|nr:RHS repeat-associated core domain-containing protein [uncultured Akkermansia sp.]